MSLFEKLLNRPQRHQTSCECNRCITEKIPIYVVLGPYGAGKTTFINHMLRLMPQENIHVLFQEYGEEKVAIGSESSGTYAHLITGASLHESRSSVMKAKLQALYANRDTVPFDCVFIEGNRIENAAKMTRLFVDEELRSKYCLATTVFVINADADDEAINRVIREKQCVTSELIVITNEEKVNKSQADELLEKLKDINPLAECHSSLEDCEQVCDAMLSMGADRIKKYESEFVETGVRESGSLVISGREELSLAALNNWLQWAFSNHGDRILYAHGAALKPDGWNLLFESVQKSFHSFSFQSETRDRQEVLFFLSCEDKEAATLIRDEFEKRCRNR